MMRTTVILLAFLLAACEGGTSAPDTATVKDTVTATDTVTDTGSGSDSDAAPDTAPVSDTVTVSDAAPDTAPAVEPFTRPEDGEPVSDEELREVTTLYLELLRDSRYFDVVDERAHGWPRSDLEGRYWYGTWWSGVKVRKEDGEVTYLHGEDGSDNNGMRTGPILDGVCYAQRIWGGYEMLLRKLVRGFNSWALCMERDSLPEQDILLARAHYPESVLSEDDGRSIHIDYSLNRPGVDIDEELPPTRYVHNPDNPWWGDIWIKNKRSKDDIGHMLQSLAHLAGCGDPDDAELTEDIARAYELYEAWCRRTEDDGFRIATVDVDWEPFFPHEDLAVYITSGGIECKSTLAIRLLGRGDEGELDCGNGISPLDELWSIKNDFHQINRSHHEAAAALAALRGRHEVAHAMLDGLAWRIDTIFAARDAGTDEGAPHDQDFAELIVNSAAVGLPLTWREVRFLHDRIREAHDSYLSDGLRPHLHVFDPETPDGEYAFTPGGAGFFFRLLAGPLAACGSAYWNPTSKPLLDCDLVRAVEL